MYHNYSSSSSSSSPSFSCNPLLKHHHPPSKAQRTPSKKIIPFHFLFNPEAKAMVTGWRRAFCTSIPKQDDAGEKIPKPVKDGRTTGNSPRLTSKFGFFSNPSTPRVPPNPPSTANLRCRTTSAATPSASAATTAASTPSSSVPGSPKGGLSSTNSPSSFSLLKSTLRLSKTRCGICLKSVKAGQGTSIFTAECSHAFHFPCIASHVQNHRLLVCPVCTTTWRDLPLLHSPSPSPSLVNEVSKTQKHGTNPPSVRIYDDDESLLSPTFGTRFIPILESDEQNEEDGEQTNVDFKGFIADGGNSIMHGRDHNNDRNVEVSLLPEAAVVSMNKAYGTYAVVLRVKGPPSIATPRAPVDLVAILDVGTGMNGEKLRSMKRAMRVLLSSLGESDRLSIVAFSSTSKRLLPLKRMTVTGRCSARRIVDAIGCTGQSAMVNDALRKAAKVLEDRREKNPTAVIMLLSDGQNHRVHTSASKQKQSPSSTMVVSSTRFGSIPVHAIGFCERGNFSPMAQQDEEFGRCLSGLLSVAVQDLRLQLGLFSGSDPGEITGVYSLMGRPAALGSGLVRVGDLFAEEERELLVELKAPSFCSGAHHVISVGSSYKDPSTRQLVYSREVPLPVPKPQSVAVRSGTNISIQRLKNLHVTARAIAESRRLMESSRESSGAYQLLSSARALVARSGSGAGDEFVRCLDAELGELQRLRQEHQGLSRRREVFPTGSAAEKGEALTPTSAWRAAERLAKVAITRKSMNRVSDLHGFENARF